MAVVLSTCSEARADLRPGGIQSARGNHHRAVGIDIIVLIVAVRVSLRRVAGALLPVRDGRITRIRRRAVCGGREGKSKQWQHGSG